MKRTTPPTTKADNLRLPCYECVGTGRVAISDPDGKALGMGRCPECWGAGCFAQPGRAISDTTEKFRCLECNGEGGDGINECEACDGTGFRPTPRETEWAILSNAARKREYRECAFVVVGSQLMFCGVLIFSDRMGTPEFVAALICFTTLFLFSFRRLRELETKEGAK